MGEKMEPREVDFLKQTLNFTIFPVVLNIMRV